MADDPTDAALAKEKFEFEKKKWEDEKELRRQENLLKQAEMDAKVKEQTALRVLIPVAAVIVGAILAGAANVAVEMTKGIEESKIEDKKERDGHTLQDEKGKADRQLERDKAEGARIAAAIKGDADQTKDNLKLLVDVGLIEDEKRKARLIEYFKSRPGGQGAGAVPSPPSPEPPQPPQPQSEATRDIVRYQSGWVGGGHNQNDECEKGRQLLQGRFAGKTLKLLSSDEQNNKDFLGHVTYNYGCVFQVG